MQKSVESGCKRCQAAIPSRDASYESMKQAKMKPEKYDGLMNALQHGALAAALALSCAAGVRAQDPTGPLTPPPEHDVRRVTTTQPSEAPPAMLPAEIVKSFAEKEEKFVRGRVQYGYKKTIKLTEFGKDGQPSGEFQLAVVTVIDSDGKLYEKIVEQPPSTLHALFQGVVWVDKKYLEVVKTYGKWVTDLGDERSPELPFTNFETYRENVEGKYWFPNYSRSDDTLHFKESGDVPVRLVIKWSDFKPLPASAVPAQATPDAVAKPKP